MKKYFSLHGCINCGTVCDRKLTADMPQNDVGKRLSDCHDYSCDGEIKQYSPLLFPLLTSLKQFGFNVKEAIIEEPHETTPRIRLDFVGYHRTLDKLPKIFLNAWKGSRDFTDTDTIIPIAWNADLSQSRIENNAAWLLAMSELYRWAANPFTYES